MARPGFADLVGRLIEAMGLNVAAVRPREEAVLVRTPDGFLLAFVDDTTRLSLDHIGKMFAEVPDAPAKVVVLTPDRLPLALGAEVARRGGTLVEGNRFTELAKGLGLADRLGEPPRADVTERKTRLLPSARFLDDVLDRARTWEEWGVPALSLRFYRHASELKPEFVPAKLGIGRSLLALGLPLEADRAFEEVLRAHPDSVDAGIGRASVLGATGHPGKEIDAYRALLAANESRSDVRAHLLAALLDANAWTDARAEVEAMLRTMPDDSRMRFLHAVTLEKLGHAREATAERERARSLGLPFDAEVALCEHLGLPAPTPAPATSPAPVGRPPAISTSKSTSRAPRSPVRAGKKAPAAARPARRGAKSRSRR
jgi:tetratricopeptide (TPR) repeat protein